MVSVVDILTYNNSTLDIVLNYFALLVTLVAVILILYPLRPTWRGRYFFIPLTVYLFLFQVSGKYLTRLLSNILYRSFCVCLRDV